MQKRGSITHEIYFMLIQIFLILSVSFFLFSFANVIIKDTELEKTLLAKDIALTLNTLQSVPGSIFYVYFNEELKMEHFRFWFYDYDVHVVEEDTQHLTFPFLQNKNLKTDFGRDERNLLMNPINLIILKSGSSFLIKSTQLTFKEYFSCPFVETHIETPKILLDAGNKDISWDIIDLINFREYNLELTRTQGQIQELNDKLTKIESIEPNIALSINIKEGYNLKNISRIYFNSELNQDNRLSKLSCLIANNIQKETNATSLIFPSNPDLFYQDDPKQIISTAFPVIYIELENIKFEQADYNIIIEVSQGIQNAIEEYYK